MSTWRAMIRLVVSGREKEKNPPKAKNPNNLGMFVKNMKHTQKLQVRSKVLLVLYTASNADENWRLREECERGQAILVVSPNTFSAFTSLNLEIFWAWSGFVDLQMTSLIFSVFLGIYIHFLNLHPLSRNSACLFFLFILNLLPITVTRCPLVLLLNFDISVKLQVQPRLVSCESMVQNAKLGTFFANQIL